MWHPARNNDHPEEAVMATELTDARWRQADLMGRIEILRANAAGNRHAADTNDAQADALVAELKDINAALEGEQATRNPGDGCRLLGDYKVKHVDCEEFAPGTITDVRTNKVVAP